MKYSIDGLRSTISVSSAKVLAVACGAAAELGIPIVEVDGLKLVTFSITDKGATELLARVAEAEAAEVAEGSKGGFLLPRS